MSTNPFQHPELYSAVKLGGVRSPGVVTLSGHDRNQDWEIKAAKGQEGASTSRNGEKIAEFTATFYLCDLSIGGAPSDLDRWDDFQRLIESTTAGPSPVALPIEHPDLARNRINQVVNGGVGGMVHDGKGGATVAVKFIEYRPPKKKASGKPKPKATSSSTTDDAAKKIADIVNDPNASAKAQLAALEEQFQKA
ncbi:MAG: hypothetical protein IPM35_18300 [Myxococcales bacterium]|nr:hypothetical protein [Myxococcales bacterium]